MSNDDTLNSHGSLVGSANSSISNIDDLSDKHSENISPRLHQLVRVGPDGRPEIVGRIGKTELWKYLCELFLSFN
jgi:hypothetical protein